jgi:hypothetical protein
VAYRFSVLQRRDKTNSWPTPLALFESFAVSLAVDIVLLDFFVCLAVEDFFLAFFAEFFLLTFFLWCLLDDELELLEQSLLELLLSLVLLQQLLSS